MLCVFVTFPLFGCVERAPTVQNGLVVTPSIREPYSTETEEYAQEVLYDLLAQYFRKTVMQILPETIMQKLRAQAVNIQKITADASLPEAQYVQCMQFLESHVDEYTDALSRLEKGERVEGDFETLKQAYTNLVSKMGADALGATIYALCIYRYDYEYETCMERYEKYGYAYLKADAEALAQDKKILQEEVGQDNFASVMQMGCLLSNLFFGGAFEEGRLASFTDHEILALLQEPSFSSIKISEKGWELLLSYLQITLPSESYFGKLFLKACENGDIYVFSMQMENFLKLLSSIQKELTIEQTVYLKENKTKKVISSIFASFGAEEWGLFEEITTLDLHKADYEEIAESLYGEGYQNYRDKVNTSSLDDLKNMAGTDDFLEGFKGYVAKISPAIAYGFTV